MSSHPGVLLINLGTPDAPRTREVRTYLREFLNDPYVIDIHPVSRWLLLNLIVLPLRPRKSARAYALIWTAEGSPLLVHTRALAAAVQERAGADVPVEFAMRYGKPTIAEGLRRLHERGARKIVALPLYPQYALSSTRSCIEKTREDAAALAQPPEVHYVEDFYDHPGFIAAQAAIAEPLLGEFRPDHVLFSFHGLPERQIKTLDTSGEHCLVRDDCCARVDRKNRACYRAQSFATARALAAALGIPEDRQSVAFQSRLGRTPWIRPYTDLVLGELPGRGVKRVAVLTPSFTADCLETLEEIGIRGREQFEAAGGEALLAVPCVNAHPTFVDAVLDLVRTEST
jgi:ferrochelatase